MYNPKGLFYVVCCALILAALHGNAQSVTQPGADTTGSKSSGYLNAIKSKGNKLYEKYIKSDDSTSILNNLNTRKNAAKKYVDTNVRQETANIKNSLKTHDSVVRHVGWQDGRVAEFNNAYTLRKNEIRLNIAGRSSWAITDRLEMSVFLPLIILPNVSFKYRFLDKPHFAIASELGGAIGIIPVAAASGLLMPGGAFGAGTLGLLTGSDIYYKMYFSWKPCRKFTFSARGGYSDIRLAYHGLLGFAAAGGSDAVVAAVPVNFKLVHTSYSMAGFETDYAITAHNALVAKVAFGEFAITGGGILYPSLTYTHAFKKHFHISAGVFKLLDYPHYYILKEKTNNSLPFDFYYNFYWTLNNRVRSRKS